MEREEEGEEVARHKTNCGKAQTPPEKQKELLSQTALQCATSNCGHKNEATAKSATPKVRRFASSHKKHTCTANKTRNIN